MMVDPISTLSSSGSRVASATGAVAGGRVEHAAGADMAGDFSQMLGEAIAGVAQQLRKAESVSIAGINGTASTQEVVEQVMAAEQLLQASIAIRDKVVAAYLEISRMQI